MFVMFAPEIVRTTARAEGKVGADDLARTFGVTVQTARRDLNTLRDRGLLTRDYGGAIPSSGTRNIGYEDSPLLHEAGKDRTGQACAGQSTRPEMRSNSVFARFGLTKP